MSEISEQSGRKAARRAIVALVVLAACTSAIFWLNPADLYLWIKAVHVVAIIAWMAGMLYLPRLFIYHCDAEPGSVQSETFKVMERRLLRVIMNPAMTVAWALGLWLAWSGGHFSSGWFHGKFAAVIALSAVHGIYSRAVRLFAEDRNDRSPRYWRVMNEVPTLLMIAIVILVIVKPF
ncbi:protoporphyrinogen oxidase HemJ [Oricola thermophila]|uniref:Protoporphyrinogen IX oxidase n=1 Tax=Oricola thermophila TaxID=2742145 RepID=A0A6N1VHA1_9HYPH|nr:protoporphyrinogen oxidase HemJ [Oricola thermophila]QKV19833.1 protoporphyrinogen oxidase HemJ [Oricola thermophila]